MAAACALFLVLAACGRAEDDPAPGGDAAGNLSAPIAAAAPQPDPPAPAPRVSEAAAAPATGAPVRRCGWIQNPTPANWWLVDRDGEWTLSIQGGHQAAGMDEMPDMSTAGWVETNGHYGYGCACLTVEADPASRRVLRLTDADPRPLAQCRSDRALPKP